MSIEPMQFQGGAGRAKIVCDDCSRSEVVPCAYLNRGKGKEHEGRPNESQARARAIAMGWAWVKGKLRCGSCEAKRKMKMRVVETEKKPEQREATADQKREIFKLLTDVYDTSAGRYMQGDTDATVADVLGVMPGWVAELREQFFGPDGGNEDIESLRDEIARFREEMTARVKSNTEENKRLIEQIEKAKGFADRLDKISKAIGPGARKKAGIA